MKVYFFFLREKKKEVYSTRSPQVFLATILVNSRIYLVCLHLPVTGVQAIIGFLKFKA